MSATGSIFQDEILSPLYLSLTECKTLNAFCINEQFHTYEQLYKKISGIRHAIKNSTFTGKNIGLVVNDDVETYASVFAIWLEGYAYVPLHPLQPVDRNLEIIAQAHIDLVLNSEVNNPYSRFTTIATRYIETLDVFWAPVAAEDDALAYILFTSGSTGKPKGVTISRKNVGAFMKAFWQTGITIDKTDKCLQCFDLTFDVSVQSYLTPLLRGACTFTVPHNQIKYSYVYGLMEDHQITFGALAPSMVRMLRPYFDEINIPSMRYCILTAEASPLLLVEEWAKCVPNAHILDFYGPTEATIYCTCYGYKRNADNKELNGMLSIGVPMPGVLSVIVDENKNILSRHEKGELCIAGDQVTGGYWENESKNAESFFDMQFNGANVRFYKTGDCCYYDDDDNIMLYGRLDYQVKIQGYRIELGEIEYHAREFLQGKNAVASAFTNEQGNNEIALFVEGDIANELAIKHYLSGKMPSYMLPAKLIAVPEFPLNANEKVDRLALKTLINI